MIGHQVTSALFAVLPLTHRGLLKHTYVLSARRDPHGVRLPKRESVHGPAGPRSARLAMAIPHAFRFTAYVDTHRAAETFAAVCCHRIFSRCSPPHTAKC